MAKRFVWLGIVLPVVFVAGHFTVMALLRPQYPHHWYTLEFAPHELGAMFLFLAAGAGALVLFARHGKAMPHGLRWLWLLYGLAALFVGLEEGSYGQHLIGWESPEYFEQTNVQNETNLHNLGGQGPQRTMRNTGEILLPIWCLVLPALFTFASRDAYDPGHWPRYLVPRWELAVTVVLAGLMRPLLEVHPVLFADKVTKEFTEFLWSWAALLLVLVIHHRLSADRQPVP